MNAILSVKLLLCFNAYLIVFFSLLLGKGFSREQIAGAISIGTVVMIAGDLATSLLVDRFGPKRIVIWAGLVQGASLFILAAAQTYGDLIIFEILMGLSFPAIYGADSKWLRAVQSEGNSSESANQGALWLGQLLGAAVGSLAVRYPTELCYANASLFLIGSSIAVRIPDAPVSVFSGREYWTKIPGAQIIFYGSLIGTSNLAFWFFQLRLSNHSFSQETFTLLQITAAALPLIGSIYLAGGTRPLHLFSAAVALFAGSIYLDSNVGLVSAVFITLCNRGSLSVFARERLFGSLTSGHPIATLNFQLNAVSKLVQGCLAFLLIR